MDLGSDYRATVFSSFRVSLQVGIAFGVHKHSFGPTPRIRSTERAPERKFAMEPWGFMFYLLSFHARACCLMHVYPRCLRVLKHPSLVGPTAVWTRAEGRGHVVYPLFVSSRHNRGKVLLGIHPSRETEEIFVPIWCCQWLPGARDATRQVLHAQRLFNISKIKIYCFQPSAYFEPAALNSGRVSQTRKPHAKACNVARLACII